MPSAADINLTDNLRKACILLNIDLVDHIILAEESFFSFSEERTITLNQ